MSEIQIEQQMEAMGLPENDRDQVRTFAEFLRCRKDKKPLTPEMKNWLLGKDAQTQEPTQ